MAGIYKAYDVRGTYPDQINEEIARQIGLAFHNVLTENDRAKSNQVVVSRDMRSHSVPLQAALIEGLTASGLDVLNIGQEAKIKFGFLLDAFGALNVGETAIPGAADAIAINEAPAMTSA